MKKKSYLIVLSIAIMFGALIWFREPVLKAAGGAFGVEPLAQNPTNPLGTPISTSTLNYLSIGAGTTTITADTVGADNLVLEVFAVSSTTATTDLRATVEFSNSTTSVAAQQLWYPESRDTTTTATTSVTSQAKEYRFPMQAMTRHLLATSTAVNNTFDPATVNVFRFEIKDITARKTRVVFYMPTGSLTDNRMDTLAESTALSDLPNATSTNAGIYVNIVGKNPL